MNYIEYAVCFVFNDANIRYTPILFTTGMMTIVSDKTALLSSSPSEFGTFPVV